MLLDERFLLTLAEDDVHIPQLFVSTANAFGFIHKIIKEINISPSEVFIPCAEDICKRHDYRSLQQLLPLIRENGYTDNKLHDDMIETCIRQTGSDVEQSREQDTLIQMIKNDESRIKVYMAVGKLRAAYLIAIRLGREDKVRLIRDDAQKTGQTAVYDLCKKWLENRASE